MTDPRDPVHGLVQWQRIAGILESRIDAAHLIVDRQSKALTQLDAAEFALSKIVEDLSAIMPLAYRRGVGAQQPVYGTRKALAA